MHTYAYYIYAYYIYVTHLYKNTRKHPYTSAYIQHTYKCTHVVCIQIDINNKKASRHANVCQRCLPHILRYMEQRTGAGRSRRRLNTRRQRSQICTQQPNKHTPTQLDK